MGDSDAIQELEQQAKGAWRQAQYDYAVQLYQQLLPLREQQAGSESPEVAEILNTLGDLAHTQADYRSADLLYRRALAIREKVLGRQHAATIANIGDLAGILDEQGDLIQAEVLYQETLTLSEQVLGPFHLDTARVLANVARFYRATGKYEQSKDLYLRALALYADTFDQNGEEGRVGDYSTCLNNFAVLLLDLAQPLQAEPHLRQAVQMRSRLSGDDHPAVAASLKNLGRAYRMQGESTLATLLFNAALLIYEKKLGTDHPDTRALKELMQEAPLKKKEERVIFHFGKALAGPFDGQFHPLEGKIGWTVLVEGNPAYSGGGDGETWVIWEDTDTPPGWVETVYLHPYESP